MKSPHSTAVVPREELPRWMLVSDPLRPLGGAYVFKGHFPQYLFEIRPSRQAENCYAIKYRSESYYINIIRDFDNRGKPPLSYFIEMLAWYKKVGARPTLDEINKLRESLRPAEQHVSRQ